ncbi:unnamed protein product [Linum trigynum]|uniref:CCHC-type domain-containing protein n=1 Tax=Linum trigynum TaxID=586398 RepID=A0AAV2D8W9_9ROSI
MTEFGSSAQICIPRFDGDYDHWSLLMENLLRSKEYWDVICDGFKEPPVGVELTTAQAKALENLQLKDLKAKNYLFCSIDKSILKTITRKSTSKELWDSMKMRYHGNERVKRARLQTLRRDFEILEMETGESINEYFGRVMVVVNIMRNYGEQMNEVKIIEKILRTLTEKFNYVVCSIEESKDIDTLTVDALQSSLLVHEQKLSKGRIEEERALKVTYDSEKDRGSYHDRRRGSGILLSRESVKCFKCHMLGHFRDECPEWDSEAQYSGRYAAAREDMKEKMLLFTCVKPVEEELPTRLVTSQETQTVEKTETRWFLDSGCSHHMTGNKNWFTSLDSSFSCNVKLGNGTRLQVAGKGVIRLKIEHKSVVIQEAFYVPGLKTNLLSVGKMQEKGLTFLIKGGVCKVFHDEKGLLWETKMRNEMFIFNSELVVSQTTNDMHCLCLQVQVHEDDLNDFEVNEWPTDQKVQETASAAKSTTLSARIVVGEKHKSLPDVFEPGTGKVVSSNGDENLDAGTVTSDPEAKELAKTFDVNSIREGYSVVEAVHIETDLPVSGVVAVGEVGESMISGIKAAVDEVVVVEEIVHQDKDLEKIVDNEDLIQVVNHMGISVETDAPEMKQIGGEMDFSGLDNDDVLEAAVLNGNQEISTREANDEEKLRVVMEDGVNGGTDQTKGATAGHTPDLKEDHSLDSAVYENCESETTVNHTPQADEHLEYGRVYDHRDSNESDVISDKSGLVNYLMITSLMSFAAGFGSFAASSGVTGSRALDTWYQQFVVESFMWYLKNILGCGIIYSKEAWEICLNGYTNSQYGDDVVNMRSTHIRVRFHFLSVLAKEGILKLDNYDYETNEEIDSIVIVILEFFLGNLHVVAVERRLKLLLVLMYLLLQSSKFADWRLVGIEDSFSCFQFRGGYVRIRTICCLSRECLVESFS